MAQTELTIECRSCNATGIYQGLAERNGIVIVCSTCGGSGAETVSHTLFTERHVVSWPTTVFAAGTQYVMSDEARGGVPYSDWLVDPDSARADGAEARDYACPASWYSTVDMARHPGWPECDLPIATTFMDCPLFSAKEKCWERWDTNERPTRVAS